MARSLDVADIRAKDESDRFGLPAFKIVGARYAVSRLLATNPGTIVDLACATAGNHGRAVARIASELGLRAHVYVPTGTAPARIRALKEEGADVTTTDVDYDETVRRMAHQARARGWTIVSDTSLAHDDEMPRAIMAGYTQIMTEAEAQWDRRPDLVVVQAGVGSLAGAIAGWLAARYGADRPKLVIAEPEGSACVLASLVAGRAITLERTAPTAMVGLRCAAVSPLAWPVLQSMTDAAIAVRDDVVDEVGRSVAELAAGASGLCGLAALHRLCRDATLAPLRASLGVTPATSAMVIVTEGATSGPRPSSSSQ
jgi:diaminopropionate ammonia-lyase